MRRLVYCVVKCGQEPDLYLSKELAVRTMRLSYPDKFDTVNDGQVIAVWRSLPGHNYWEEWRSL